MKLIYISLIGLMLFGCENGRYVGPPLSASVGLFGLTIGATVVGTVINK